MWNVLDTVVRRPLFRHFRAQALELHRHALFLLGDGAGHDGRDDVVWARSLLTTVTAGAACWYVLQPAVGSRQWRSIKRGLNRQRRLVGPLEAAGGSVVVSPRAAFRGIAGRVRGSDERRLVAALVEGIGRGRLAELEPAARRTIERTLLEQSAWLRDADTPGDTLEPMMRARIVRAYDKARNGLRRDPGSGGTRRRLARYMWIEELLAGRTGPIVAGRFPTSATGRLWMGLQETRWLRRLPATGPAHALGGVDARRLAGLLRRRRRELATCRRRLAADVLGGTAREFATGLPWRLFLALAEAPVPLELRSERPAQISRPQRGDDPRVPRPGIVADAAGG